MFGISLVKLSSHFNSGSIHNTTLVTVSLELDGGTAKGAGLFNSKKRVIKKIEATFLFNVLPKN